MMSNADRSQYADAVTTLSEAQLQEVISVAEPPICLLGGWAVHLHVNEGFRDAHGRSYIGSRDIDLGVHVDPEWQVTDLKDASVATTLERIETDLGYNRGRFGFYKQFHRETGETLTDDEAMKQPAHNIFRVDIDIIPDTTALDAFEDCFGFRPPAEPLLAPAFADEQGEPLDDYVPWTAPEEAAIASPASLAAMKVRAFPDRDKSHKRLKDLADLHALLWYTGEYGEMRSAVRDRVTAADVERFQGMAFDGLYVQTARLIGGEPDVVEQSIEQLFV
jgi:hypothetical protein